MPVIIALDEAWAESQKWVDRLGDEVWGFKVGSILYAERGPAVVEAVLKRGAKVFLDLKYHDIPNTVQKSVRNAFAWGVDFLTVHACGGKEMLEAAAAEQKNSCQVIAVTVLTSFDDQNLQSVGVQSNVETQVKRLAELAIQLGVKGLVCSPLEVSNLRKKFSNATLITPGIRSINLGDDQKRTESLRSAVESGASFGVVGRAITGAEDWKKSWNEMRSSMDGMF